MNSPFINKLSVRTQNVLRRMGLTRRDAIERAVLNRTLHPSNTKALGCGAKCVAELRAALGLKPDLTDQQVHGYRARFADELNRDGLTWREISRVLRLRGPGEAMELAASGKRAKSVRVAVRDQSGQIVGMTWIDPRPVTRYAWRQILAADGD